MWDSFLGTSFLTTNHLLIHSKKKKKTAPEILRREKYCEKVDIYSLGIVFWECLIRENPYKGLDAYQVVFAVATQGLRPVIPDSVSPALSLLIQKCWSEDPSKRPSASNLLEQLHRIQ